MGYAAHMNGWFGEQMDALLFKPAFILEDFFAILLVVRGLFYWLIPDQTYLAPEVFSFAPAIVVIMVMFIAPGVMILYNRRMKKLHRRQQGLFLGATMYGVGTLLAIVMTGFTPTTWIYPFGASLIMAALWLRSKMNGDIFDEQNEVYFRRRWQAFRESR